MPIAVLFDSRPSTFGNMMVVTGSFVVSGGDSGGVIDVSEHLSELLGVSVTSADATTIYAWHTDTSDTTFNVVQGATDKSGRFMAMGKR
tara:strand:- start:3568 stop:3834 length:267 start_codon:yes stop_codon:yes gene_type:complete